MRLPSRVDRKRATVREIDADASEPADGRTLLKQAEAEAVEAEARATEARARADELRQNAGRHPADDGSAPEDTTDPLPGLDASKSRPAIRWRRPKPASMVAVAAMLAGISLLAASGYLLWGHHLEQREQQRRAAFAAAASQAVVTLMSIDSAKAEDNVRQILDNSTGQFRDDFRSEADDFVKTAQQSKAATKASAQAVAVESMTPNSATVLVTAATTVSNSAGADQQPRNWRLSVDMVDDGQQMKLTKVEFVP
ncbi:VirB8 protein [Mycolicibacterium chubuense NBB4]|uniref:VirB8 protein n=1 Tax=Mycolicibacterium chubuense (strain NBB4) TaxID=710421 RepID=I4BGK1_MYCCN|nr:type 4b pilus protein PilO2 [Mycolicibacterium chubuense]AFM16408.1 VirB8 protein [Mycolicibacterium chubuense NBB4]